MNDERPNMKETRIILNIYMFTKTFSYWTLDYVTPAIDTSEAAVPELPWADTTFDLDLVLNPPESSANT